MNTIDDWIDEAEREGDAIAAGRKADVPLTAEDRVEIARLRDEARADEALVDLQLVKTALSMGRLKNRMTS